MARGGAGHARDGARGSVAIEFHEAVACLATAGTPHERAAAISTSYATNASDATDDSYSSYAASSAGHGHLMREAISMPSVMPSVMPAPLSMAT